ncbi:MAG TPA: kelch repeat-containing protein [Polyangia bacterium]
MRVHPRAALGGVIVALVCGCTPDKEPSVGLQLRMAPGLSSQSTCSATTTLLSSSEATTVRLTVMRRGDHGPEFICDRVMPLASGPSDQPKLYAPVTPGERVEIIAEAWKSGGAAADGGPRTDAGQKDGGHDGGLGDAGDGGLAPEAGAGDAAASDAPAPADAPAPGDAPVAEDAPAAADAARDAGRADAGPGPSGAATLIASGQTSGVDLRGTGTYTLYLDESRAFSCVGNPTSFARSFHSATLIPDGRVLLVGGLVGDVNGGATVDATRLYATANVELYDPATQTFTTLEDKLPDARVARAFHDAYLLESADPTTVSLLLVGGVAPKDKETTPIIDMHEQAVLNLSPSTQTKPAPVEVLVIDLPTGTYTHSTPLEPAKAARFMQASMWQPPSTDGARPGYFVVAGGAAVGAGTQTQPPPVPSLEVLDESGSGAPLTPVLLAGGGRLGATLTPVDAFRPNWLLLGGNLWSETVPGKTPAETAAELVTANANGAPQLVQATLVPLATMNPTLDPTAFHTASPMVEDTGAIATVVMGGFVIQESATVPGQMTALNPQAPGRAVSPLRVFKSGPKVEEVPLPAGLKATGHHEAVLLGDGTLLVTGGAPFNDGLGNATCPPENPLCHNQCPFNTECPARNCPGGKVQQKGNTMGPCAVCQAFRYWHAPAPGARRVEVQGDLKVPRFGHRATLLADGTVLITGGLSTRLADGCTGKDTIIMVTATEIYNPRGSSAAEDPLAALGVDRAPGQQQADECCVCPSSMEETDRLARTCTGARKCTWKL